MFCMVNYTSRISYKIISLSDRDLQVGRTVPALVCSTSIIRIFLEHLLSPILKVRDSCALRDGELDSTSSLIILIQNEQRREVSTRSKSVSWSRDTLFSVSRSSVPSWLCWHILNRALFVKNLRSVTFAFLPTLIVLWHRRADAFVATTSLPTTSSTSSENSVQYGASRDYLPVKMWCRKADGAKGKYVKALRVTPKAPLSLSTRMSWMQSRHVISWTASIFKVDI